MTILENIPVLGIGTLRYGQLNRYVTDLAACKSC